MRPNGGVTILVRAKVNSSESNKPGKYGGGTKRATTSGKHRKIKGKYYVEELFRLQLELVKLQRWIVD